MERKAIVAMINGALYIDPSDATKETLEKLQAKFDVDVKVVVAPIQTWMPESGTKALMNEAMKSLDCSHKRAVAQTQDVYKNRHEQRKLKSFIRKK